MVIKIIKKMRSIYYWETLTMKKVKRKVSVMVDIIVLLLGLGLRLATFNLPLKWILKFLSLSFIGIRVCIYILFVFL